MAARGNPHPNGSKPDKIWREAIMRAVRRLETEKPRKKAKPEQKLELLADALVAKGIDQDVSALREIGDRLDGKAVQPMEHGVGDGLEELLGYLSGKTDSA